MSENQTQQQNDQSKKPLSALERLELLEQQMASVGNLVNHIKNLMNQNQRSQSAINMLGTTLNSATNSLSALLDILDNKGIIQESDMNQRLKEMDVERKKQVEESLIAQKLLSEGLEVSNDTFLVLNQTNSETGNVEVERDHIDMSKMDQKVKDLFLGKSVGEKVEHEGKVLEILRVLEPVKAASVGEEVSAQSSESASSSSDNSSDASSSSESGSQE